jgi:polysaccharide deacetylase 2 family uncharacterized protein YibQ
MTDPRGGVLSRLLVLLALAWAGWYFYTHYASAELRSKISPQVFGGRLENAVNQELTRLGISDKDVVSQVRKEHTQWILTWVETDRTIAVKSQSDVQDVSHSLERVALRMGCSFNQDDLPAGVKIEIKRFLWVLQRFLIVPQAPTGKGKSRKTPQAAFVIDDVAYETVSMDHFASLGVPLTFAILPREKHSKELARKANALNFPVMLHLPMEPLDMAHNDPGPSGLYLKMSEPELKAQFEKNYASVPNLVGINNHMGSAFTENEPKMTMVLEWVKKKGVYFLDSRTSGHSVVCKVAKHVGVPCLANETFLDNKDEVKDIEAQLDQVIKLALRDGQTIAIGHYHRKYLVQALANKIPEFKARGVQIVTLPTFYPAARR